MTIDKIPMPHNEGKTNIAEIVSFLNQAEEGNTLFVIEKVSIRPSDERAGKTTRLEAMIRNQESCVTIAKMCGLDIAQVHPRTWQSEIGLNLSGQTLTTARRKAEYRNRASGYFSHRFTRPTGDAACIALWAHESLLNHNDKLVIEKAI